MTLEAIVERALAEFARAPDAASLEDIKARYLGKGGERRDDVNQALNVGGRQAHGNVEVKYAGPDAIMLDVSETGWLGTPSFGGSA